MNGVVGPAFTCAVVHQAMQLSGLPVRLVDSEPSGYLMHADDLRKAAEGPSAVVLCEVYGLRYGVEGAALAGNHGPVGESGTWPCACRKRTTFFGWQPATRRS